MKGNQKEVAIQFYIPYRFLIFLPKQGIGINQKDLGIGHFENEAAELARGLIGDPVLILSDLFGGSPIMTLLSVFRDNDYKLISGFNLPMIIEALSQDSSTMSLQEAAEQIVENGKNLSIRLVDKLQEEGGVS